MCQCVCGIHSQKRNSGSKRWVHCQRTDTAVFSSTDHLPFGPIFSYQQYVAVPVSPPPHPHRVWSDFLIFVNMKSEKHMSL